MEEPVFVFTLAIVAFLVGPLVIKRLGQPGIVGVVLLGALLGPAGPASSNTATRSSC